ncbi:MAG: N-acetyl-gamma-glutamyl-phosphate reductase [Myxococcales bacterium]|nr:N-acetyl-gamma-glutamyl-phosphate reductase [Myxococcales bacterium]
MIRACVVGATGYVGAELCRWVLAHPLMELSRCVSHSRAGEPLGDAVPGLLGCTDLVLSSFDDAVADHDVVFLATPHGAAAPLMPAMRSASLVVDASADHRNAEGWVYGPPEHVAEALSGARRVSCPGCFATTMELALAPLVRHALLAGPVHVSATTGSTGSGASPKAATHHPERSANLRAYKVGVHQHVPEVRTWLQTLGPCPHLAMVPQSGPFDRGIFATVFAPIAADVDVAGLFADTYGPAPLIRLRAGSPELRHVRGTAFADLSVHGTPGTAIVLVALDNLGKGAASQAVQCANAALDLPQDTGLRVPGALP